MKIWINKSVEEDISEEFKNAAIFNILEENRDSNIKTDIEKLWRSFGVQKIENNYEDFMIIAISIFSVDKRISRSYVDFKDSWTRNFKVSIPVLNYMDWVRNKSRLEDILNFLTGDKWDIEFRETSYKYRQRKSIRIKHIYNPKLFEVLSLFSGGLDSYCGAIKLLESGMNTCFVGFKEYNLLKKRQLELFNGLDAHYARIEKALILFNVRPYCPLLIDRTKMEIKPENSSRSRSILFIAGALLVASLIDNNDIHIPENGFIGVNVPLSDSRQGSCSTRTTHPFFINTLNSMLNDIGISNKIRNFYSSLTKGEIVEEFMKHPLFVKDAGKTISCSHPCQSRYDQIRPPKNCGYCYPCIIRKAALNKINYNSEKYNPNYDLDGRFLNKYSEYNSKSSDFVAILNAMRTYCDIQNNVYAIYYMLLKNGNLSYAELQDYKRVYEVSMNELFNLVLNTDNHKQLLDYMGIEEGKV